MLAPTTIFHSVISFMTNTDLQHYAGDQHLSIFSQLFFVIPNLFLSAAVGLCALTAIIRALRGEETVGNFFVDMWRVLVYTFVPIALIAGVLFLHQGMPMTYGRRSRSRRSRRGRWASPTRVRPRPQRIVVGPWPPSSPSRCWARTAGGSTA